MLYIYIYIFFFRGLSGLCCTGVSATHRRRFCHRCSTWQTVQLGPTAISSRGSWLTTSRLQICCLGFKVHKQSTEMTVLTLLKVLADILGAADRGDRAMLTWSNRRPQDAPASPRVVTWCQRHSAQYLVSRRLITVCLLRVIIKLFKAVLFGVPQGLVLELILFLLHTADLLSLVETHTLWPHLYADGI